MKTCLFLIAVVLCIGCSQDEDRGVKPYENWVAKPPEVKRSLERVFSDSLYMQSDSVDFKELDVYKFGDFFLDRASFYVVPYPDMTILEAQVNELTIFCLDGIPSKQKYLLDKDVSDTFINRYRCTLRPKDQRNLAIAQSEGWVKRENGRLRLNSKLDNYELVSVNGIMKVRLLVQGNSFFYIEESIDYDKKFRRIEASW